MTARAWQGCREGSLGHRVHGARTAPGTPAGMHTQPAPGSLGHAPGCALARPEVQGGARRKGRNRPSSEGCSTASDGFDFAIGIELIVAAFQTSARSAPEG